MTMGYARTTNVSVERSRQELETLLRRVGASQVMIGWDGDVSFVAFAINNVPVKQMIAMPPRDEYTQTETGRSRKTNAATAAWEQACRQRMREYVLLLKAKLVAIELGHRTVEQEFLYDLCLPGNTTVGMQWGQEIQAAITGSKLPKLLLGSA